MGFIDIFKKKESEPVEGEIVETEALPVPTVEPALLKLGYTKDDSGNWAGFYLPEDDRSTHLYVLGSSGVGKSKGLATWILEDISHGRGCGVIDPHDF